MVASLLCSNPAGLSALSKPAWGVCGGCAGASGIGTSEKSSCETAFIVHESSEHQASYIQKAYIRLLTNTNSECENANTRDSILYEVGLTGAEESRAWTVVLVVISGTGDFTG